MPTEGCEEHSFPIFKFRTFLEPTRSGMKQFFWPKSVFAAKL